MNLFATVLFTVCSAVTVECCVLYPCCVNVFGMFCSYVRKKALLQCLQLLRWDGDYVSQPPYVWYYVGVKISFQHGREECESKRAYVF